MKVRRLALTIGEVSQALGVSHWSVRRFINKGNLGCVRLGGRILVPRGELDRVLALPANPVPVSPEMCGSVEPEAELASQVEA